MTATEVDAIGPGPRHAQLQLAHVLVHDRLSLAGIRALTIKGPCSEAHGLRSARVSADADVLVEPNRFDDALAAMREVGFNPRPTSAVTAVISTHAVATVHRAWPIDIDLHRRFPGMTEDPTVTFDLLWDARAYARLGNSTVPIAGLSHAMLIDALHVLREPHRLPRARAEYDRMVRLAETLLGDLGLGALVIEARRLGALETARPFLVALGQTLPPAPPRGSDPNLDDWLERSEGSSGTAGRLWRASRGMPGKARLRLLAGAVFQSERDFRIDHPETPAGGWALARARARRVGSGLRTAGVRVASRGLCRKLAPPSDGGRR